MKIATRIGRASTPCDLVVRWRSRALLSVQDLDVLLALHACSPGTADDAVLHVTEPNGRAILMPHAAEFIVSTGALLAIAAREPNAASRRRTEQSLHRLNDVSLAIEIARGPTIWTTRLLDARRDGRKWRITLNGWSAGCLRGDLQGAALDYSTYCSLDPRGRWLYARLCAVLPPGGQAGSDDWSAALLDPSASRQLRCKYRRRLAGLLLELGWSTSQSLGAGSRARTLINRPAD